MKAAVSGACKVIMAGHVYVPADKVLLTPLPVQ